MLQNVGLRLPSLRTLYDYRNYVSQAVGIVPEHLNQLESLLPSDRNNFAWWGVLQFDEVQVKAGLTFHAWSGSLVGFVDLNQVDINLFEKAAEDNSKDNQNSKLHLAEKNNTILL